MSVCAFPLYTNDMNAHKQTNKNKMFRFVKLYVCQGRSILFFFISLLFHSLNEKSYKIIIMKYTCIKCEMCFDTYGTCDKQVIVDCVFKCMCVRCAQKCAHNIEYNCIEYVNRRE